MHITMIRSQHKHKRLVCTHLLALVAKVGEFFRNGSNRAIDFQPLTMHTHDQSPTIISDHGHEKTKRDGML